MNACLFFQYYSLQIKESIVNWKYYTKLYELQSKSSLKSAFKITINHIQPSYTQKMRVYLATQVNKFNL